MAAILQKIIPPNPLNEERRQRLKEESAEFLANFSKTYLKMYGAAILEKIERETNGVTNKKQLTYRDWDCIDRPKDTLFAAYAFVKTGTGPGSWGKWEKVFLSERLDYKIDFHKTEDDYKMGKKPTDTLSVCGYHLRHDTNDYFSTHMKKLAEGLGFAGTENKLTTNFSVHSWALTHPWRPNYIFQLHRSKEPSCCGGAVAPEDENEGHEAAEQRNSYTEFMERCVAKCKVRDENDISSVALNKTFEQLKESIPELRGWRDNGTEAEMIVDAMMEAVWSPLREDMLEDMKLIPVKLRLSILYKITGVVKAIFSVALAASWAALKTITDTLSGKVESIIKLAATRIFKLKKDIKEKIRASLSTPFENVKGKIGKLSKPILNVFEKPMRDGFDAARSVFEKRVDLQQLPRDEEQLISALDNIPRSTETREALHVLRKIPVSLEALRDNDNEAFESLDTGAFLSQAEQCILTTMDAAINTLEIKMKESGTANFDQLKNEVLQAYDHDMLLNLRQFVLVSARQLLTPVAKNAVLGPVQAAIAGVRAMIPDDLEDAMSLDDIVLDTIENVVEETIEMAIASDFSSD